MKAGRVPFAAPFLIQAGLLGLLADSTESAGNYHLVKKGDPVELSCSAPGGWSECRWQHNNFSADWPSGSHRGYRVFPRRSPEGAAEGGWDRLYDGGGGGDGRVSLKATLTTCYLMLEWATAQDHGEWECALKTRGAGPWAVERHLERHTLEVLRPLVVALTVPEGKYQKEELQVLSGATYPIQCSSIGGSTTLSLVATLGPNQHLVEAKDRTLRLSDSYSSPGDGTQTAHFLYRAQTEDQGAYIKCSARQTFPGGEKGEQKVNDTIYHAVDSKLVSQVFYKPMFLAGPMSRKVTVKNGEDVVLKFKFRANPVPQLDQVKFKSSYLDQDKLCITPLPVQFIVNGTDVLVSVFHSYAQKKDGTKKYSLEVENDFGKAVYDFELELKPKEGNENENELYVESQSMERSEQMATFSLKRINVWAWTFVGLASLLVLLMVFCSCSARLKKNASNQPEKKNATQLDVFSPESTEDFNDIIGGRPQFMDESTINREFLRSLQHFVQPPPVAPPSPMPQTPQTPQTPPALPPRDPCSQATNVSTVCRRQEQDSVSMSSSSAPTTPKSPSTLIPMTPSGNGLDVVSDDEHHRLIHHQYEDVDEEYIEPTTLKLRHDNDNEKDSNMPYQEFTFLLRENASSQSRPESGYDTLDFHRPNRRHQKHYSTL